MQCHRCGLGQGADACLQFLALRLQRVHARLHALVEHAFCDGIHHIVDLFAQGVQSTHVVFACECIPRVGLAQRALIFHDEGAHHIRMHQLMADPCEDASLDIFTLNGFAIVTGAPVARGRTAIAGGTDHDVIRSAAPAAQKP